MLIVGANLIFDVTFYDTVGGSLTDPTTITFTVNKDGSVFDGPYTYAAGQVTRTSVGVYRYVWTIPNDATSGAYVAEWQGVIGGETKVGTEAFSLPATDTYATLSELKSFVGITDTSDDENLSTALLAATGAINQHCHRNFNVPAVATTRTFRALSDRLVFCDDIANTTGLVVATDTNGDGSFSTTWLGSEWQVEPVANDGTRPYTALRAVEARYFPTDPNGRATVRVTAQWGWPQVPADVKMANLILASRYFKRKDSPEGTLGLPEIGVVRLSRHDADVMALLAPFVRQDIGRF